MAVAEAGRAPAAGKIRGDVLSYEELDKREIAEWEMPDIEEGAIVKWFPGPALREADATMGIVARVRPRCIVMHCLVTGDTLRAVKHKDDPKLRLHQDQREDGAWDYTENYLNNQKLREAVDLLVKHDVANKNLPAELRVSARKAAIDILGTAGEPVHASDIFRLAVGMGYQGTEETLTSTLYKAKSVFVSEGQGKFSLVKED